MACLHSKKHKVSRPRGLCWSCWNHPGVKEKYPVLSCLQNHRGVGNRGQNCVRPPSVPTGHPPGSPGKVEEMARRAEEGRPLFVKGDATWDVSGSGLFLSTPPTKDPNAYEE